MRHATYWNDDDILELRFSEKPIAREASESWHVHKSYAADGELVAVVFLDAVKEGYFTPAANSALAAPPSRIVRLRMQPLPSGQSFG